MGFSIFCGGSGQSSITTCRSPLFTGDVAVAFPPPPPPATELNPPPLLPLLLLIGVAVKSPAVVVVGVDSVSILIGAPTGGVATTAAGDTAAAALFSTIGPLALEMLRPGGSPAGNSEDGEIAAGGITLGTVDEGVEEAAVVVTTISTGGIDFRFKLRHGFRAARRRSTTDSVRRAFL